jgi:hypothetical protein
MPYFTARHSIVLIFLKRLYVPNLDFMNPTNLKSSVWGLKALEMKIQECGPVRVLKHIDSHVPKRSPEDVFVNTDDFCINAISTLNPYLSRLPTKIPR